MHAIESLSATCEQSDVPRVLEKLHRVNPYCDVLVTTSDALATSSDALVTVKVSMY